ncbi:MAG: helix-turn-helix transcriptional regulator [Parafilimonas sp.]
MSQLQLSLFQHIKSALPANLSMADEVADILNVSIDSAYRRIRGEKQLSFEEIQKLSDRFGISVDKILSLKSDSILFSGDFINSENFNFLKYLDNIYSNIQHMTSFEQKELFYFSKDIPIYYYCMFPELAAFKFFAWMKTLLQFPDYAIPKFSMEKVDAVFFEKAKKIALLSCQLPTTEILNVEHIQTTLRQIEYYKDTDLFESKSDLDLQYNKLEEMNDHMEKMCAAGRKFMPGQKPLSSYAPLKMYVNFFVIGGNSMVAVLNGKKMCFLLHNVINILRTHDEGFCNYTYNFVHNIITKSTQISEVGERERTIFFNLTRQSINLNKQNEIKTIVKLTPYY